jgi:hypothetical protein
LNALLQFFLLNSTTHTLRFVMGSPYGRMPLNVSLDGCDRNDSYHSSGVPYGDPLGFFVGPKR